MARIGRDADSRTLHTLDETADILRCSLRTVHRLVAAGELRSLKLGRRRLVAADDLAAYVRTLHTRP